MGKYSTLWRQYDNYKNRTKKSLCNFLGILILTKGKNHINLQNMYTTAYE